MADGMFITMSIMHFMIKCKSKKKTVVERFILGMKDKTWIDSGIYSAN